jgi:hypothetical protein
MVAEVGFNLELLRVRAFRESPPITKSSFNALKVPAIRKALLAFERVLKQQLCGWLKMTTDPVDSSVKSWR